MKRTVIAITMAIVSFLCFGVATAQEKKDKEKDATFEIIGRVKESFAHKDLVKAKVYVTDTLGNHVDSVTAGGRWYGDRNGMVERAEFSFKVPRRVAIYNIEVVMPEYKDYYFTLRLDKIGRREHRRVLPDFIMERAPKELKGVTVTSSKVKFYNRGDTLVFNADAFDLAEGSMLDALVKQMPGVEIREGGQIYVNGEYVESLLLNGKDFFNGNNELMLDNLAAYTVQNVEVYKRSSDLEKWMGIKGEQDLVMDVKLKREYNIGWVMNFEAGVGTEERYMARAFINRFTNHSRLTFIGNVNNLNDNRKPGESSTWTPESNTAGTMKTQMGGVDYMVEERDEKWKISGNAMVRHTTQTDEVDVQRDNFLNSTRTYDYSFSRNHFKNLSLTTDHTANWKNDDALFISGNLGGEYTKTTSNSSYLGASFRNERHSVTAGAIDSLYSGDLTKLDDLINRNKTETLNSGHSGNGRVEVGMNYKVPHTSDYMALGVFGNFTDSKNEVWRDYTINYGPNPTPAVRENQYFDNSPNRDINFGARAGYTYTFDSDCTLTLRYQYLHEDQHKDSYMYALDRLSDMGIIGTLPEGYLSSFDASRSYRSHMVGNQHDISLRFYRWREDLWIMFAPMLRYSDSNFHYFRDDKDYNVCQRHALFILGQYQGQIGYSFTPGKFNGRQFKKNRLNLRLQMVNTQPDAVKMVDVTDDTDPLNIWHGNPDLKVSTKYVGELYWTYNTPVKGNMFNNSTYVAYETTHNQLVNGYTYDTSTGVRHNRTYNVASGNYIAKFHLTPSLQFGGKSQFTASYFGGVDYIHSADMIGTDVETPVKSTVYTYWQVHKLNFQWQMGKQQVSFAGELQNRFTDSDREKFESISATHCNMSLRGNFKLPKGFGIATDFTVYMRRGYGSKELDTTDPVWNARLSYTPPKSNWVLMLDGFDMLHQLSSVKYAVTSQGRTVTFTNVLPRYIMFHVQYRLNIQPKRKTVKENRVTWDR